MNKVSLNKIKFKKPEDPMLPFQDPIEIFCAQRFKGYYIGDNSAAYCIPEQKDDSTGSGYLNWQG